LQVELLSEKANAQKMAQPLLGSKQHGNGVHDDAEGQGGAQQGQNRVRKLLRRLGLLQDGLETSSIRSQLRPWGNHKPAILDKMKILFRSGTAKKSRGISEPWVDGSHMDPILLRGGICRLCCEA
jgi:hypothetical protein